MRRQATASLFCVVISSESRATSNGSASYILILDHSAAEVGRKRVIGREDFIGVTLRCCHVECRHVTRAPCSRDHISVYMHLGNHLEHSTTNSHVASSHGQLRFRAHCSPSDRPRRVRNAVLEFHRQPSSYAHFCSASFPREQAASAQRLRVPQVVMIEKTNITLDR